MPFRSPCAVQRKMPPHLQPFAVLRCDILVVPNMRFQLLQLFGRWAKQLLSLLQFNPTNCQGSSSVIPGLGVCLSELVQVPTATGTSTGAIPSVTGLTNPTVVSTHRALAWWEILLMALGCAFIFMMFLLCWRRRARKQRAKRTAMFASVKRLDHKLTWRGRLARFGERLFGHSPKRVVLPTNTWESDEMKLQQMRDAEEARRGSADLDQFINAYDYSKEESRHSKASSLPGLDDRTPPFKTRRKPPPPSISSRLSAHSIYSEVTGQPRHMPEPRQPIRKDLLSSRLSSSTLSSFSIRARDPERAPAAAARPTVAEAYASSVRPALMASPPLNPGAYWLKPTNTGGSTNNPFRHFS
ncbi:hypothetical protein DXG01_016625 [Tephrocybe rancida]|nr:hypothetical protein DXG01_016625 [Tephrocybe rancida]